MIWVGWVQLWSLRQFVFNFNCLIMGAEVEIVYNILSFVRNYTFDVYCRKNTSLPGGGKKIKKMWSPTRYQHFEALDGWFRKERSCCFEQQHVHLHLFAIIWYTLDNTWVANSTPPPQVVVPHKQEKNMVDIPTSLMHFEYTSFMRSVDLVGHEDQTTFIIYILAKCTHKSGGTIFQLKIN